MHAADDDAILRREPLRDDAQPVDEAARAHDLLSHDTFGVHDIHDLARLVGDDRLVWHEQRIERLQRKQPQLTEHARRDEAGRVLDDSAQPNRAGASVESVVEKVHAAVPAIFVLVGQLDVDRVRSAARRTALTALILAQVL